MKKLNNKGIIATEVFSILFIPGTIPLLIGVIIYKLFKKDKNKKILQNL